MLVGWVNIISRLDRQTQFQMFTLDIFRRSCWWSKKLHEYGDSVHTGLCKIAQNISTNISSLVKRRDD